MKYELKNKETNIETLEDLFISRGIERAKLIDFLRPTIYNYLPPLNLDNMEKGINILSKHLERQNTIDLVVDCDVDGYTSAAQIYLFIKYLSPNTKVRYHIHEGKQHGLNDMMPELRVLDELNLVICPDSSSNDYDEHEELFNMNVDVLVLDHHEAEYYSPFAVVINNQLSKKYTNKFLSGATVVYKFLNYYADYFNNEELKEFTENLIDLAAVGAIGDMMSVADLENRYLFDYGLKNINNYGLKVLIDKQSFSLGDTTKLSPIGIAFYIVPLINALIRVGSMKEKEILFRSFVEGDVAIQSTKRGAKEGQMESIAAQNARNCTNAKARQKRMEDKAIDYLQMIVERDDLNKNKILVITIDDPDRIDTTITGLVAMKAMNLYHKPVLLGRLNDEGVLKGSIRNDDKSELKDLRQFLLDSGLFEYVQGHANAAGFALPAHNIDSFNQYANEKLKDVDFNEGVYSVDFILDKESSLIKSLFMDIDYYNNIFGQNFAEPLIVIEDIPVDFSDVQIMGRTADTIKFMYNNIEYIQFRAKELIKELSEKQNVTITVMGRGAMNHFMGKETPQLIISDYNIRDSILDF